MGKSVHNKNNWEEVKKIREIMNQGSPLCSESLLKLDEKYRKTGEVCTRSGYDNFVSPLQALSMMVKTGTYPPPELLEWLVNCFEYYYDGSGAVSLEHVLFGREVQNSGNHAGQKAKDYLYSAFEDWLRFERYQAKTEDRKPKTQLKTFDSFKEDSFFGQKVSDDIDPESFLKNWRRWRKSTKS